MFRDHRNITLDLIACITTHVDKETFNALEDFADEIDSNLHDVAGMILTDQMSQRVEKRRRAKYRKENKD